MKERNLVLSLLLVTLVAPVMAKSFDFIDADFDAFSQRVLATETERSEFRGYYSALTEKIKEADDTKKRATFNYLYQLALTNLEKKHSDWYADLKPFVSDPRFTLDEQFDQARGVVKFFLTRYGAYEEFLNVKNVVKQQEAQLAQAQKPVEAPGLWDTVKSYAQAARDKISGLFGSSCDSCDSHKQA